MDCREIKKVFSEWIDNGHNNFNDENTIILCVELTDGLLLSHGTRYEFNFHFEEDNFDEFADKLKECDVEYVHPIVEHHMGTACCSFHDPDKHIIEVGENMKIVCKRFLDSGMTPEQVAERMGVPMKFVNACMR